MKKNFEYTPEPRYKQIFEDERNTVLDSAFYVVMDKNYTATVRNLNSLLEYLRTATVDESFGEIIKVSEDYRSKGTGNFYSFLIDIIAQYKGFASFNTCKHTFVECTEEQQTISIKTKGGKRITIAVMENAGCVDIHYGDSEMNKHDNGSSDGLPQFEIIGFHGGGTPVKKTPVTLTTIML